jgi:hypothetical protein
MTSLYPLEVELYAHRREPALLEGMPEFGHAVTVKPGFWLPVESGPNANLSECHSRC